MQRIEPNATELRLLYNKLNKQVLKEIRDDWRRHLNNLADKAQVAAECGNTKDLYNIIRELSNTFSNKSAPVKSKDGKILVTMEEQLERWKEHF